MGFQKNFVWGAATSAYQVEGAFQENGKGLSIWDEFCKIPGRIQGGQTGQVACDHYHRFKQDITLMKEIGIKAYRFSISWTRVLPHGTGEVNEAGLQFYEELVDELLANGIMPYATLFHWDYPAELQQKGGWLNPESPEWFENYVTILAKRFRGKIKHYFTINEPQCFIGLGYSKGELAPGLRCSDSNVLAMVHHVLLAHGLAVRALRKYGGDGLQIGTAQCGKNYVPVSESDEDIRAARQATFAVPNTIDDLLFSVSLWSDPIFKGDYPQAYYEKYADILPLIKSGDLELIHQPIDFYGQNLYSATLVQAEKDSFRFAEFPAGTPRNSVGWAVVPSGPFWCAKFLYERYGKPIFISENGMAAHDTVSLDGRVHDPNRIDYLHRHLLSLQRAVKEGIDVTGYFQWSLMDNFEWTNGYEVRFGMVYVDYKTQQRILKDSAQWYSDVIVCNGQNL
ncbi:MAG: GH1 family beta-glucosidase [Oscillospiraceae bacterium]|nr:GH1 family beta-glucosidase [Oscillospiraceae bacterium]